ncbi:pyridine nucleotide-disulfide oxidoreductase-domain-containing protein [Diplogelasinospora grovesii]|uniref:Pyridine nucleotide-disulfide oxidoreductase-domain-containing protein n=1 Tax=Diplogelasinospora grovesii TaxID=303347 RepID=A0AAN6S8L8_9PEZI|nr:pyridine nucleotide-disulfide oxidoreductase-domain-containing protein [Diplogelasinospora grovesii]
MPHAIAGETLFLDVAIIGAGWYGLKAASTLLKLAPNTTLAIFDKYDSVGGAWCRDRIYPNLVAQVEFGYFNYPSTPMPQDGKPGNNLVSGDMICRYLEQFAEDNDLKRLIRFNSWVSNIERNRRGCGWVLTVNSRRVEAAKLICATGVTTQTNAPGFTVPEDSIPVKHVVDLAKAVPSFSDAANKLDHFVLLGGAKSAYDAAYLLCSLGKKVTWVIREDGSGPMPIMPAKMLGRNTITMGTSRLMSNLSPSIMTTDSPIGAFFHRTWLGRWLTKAAWGYISTLADKAAGFGTTAAAHTEALRPEIKDNRPSHRSAFWCDSSLGLITMEDFWSTLRKGDIIIVRDNIDTTDSTGVKLRSGKRVDADYVIYATGWGDHFSFFSPELKEELGIPQYGDSTLKNTNKTLAKETVPGGTTADPWVLQDKAADELIAKKLPLLAAGPKDFNGWQRSAARQRAVKVRRWRLYNRMVPLADNSDDHSIAILGQIHTTQTPTIAEIQALWAAAYLLGDISLPSKPDVMREIAEWNAWTRKRYASVGERYPYALFDWVPYLDRLMRDLGLSTKRHNGVLADFFLPYGPHCYHGVVAEYMAVRKRENLGSRLGEVSSASSIPE